MNNHLRLVPKLVDYAESSYFEGYHFQHIAAYYEKLRLAYIHKEHQRHARNRVDRFLMSI